ncbi:MAG: type II toxin-antitoxin system HicA family toxin [Myxococcaceae bacterium]|nr:type II toxin-antitoxin system HicA family toxin [Myxococcaceae bacterium]
MSADDRVLDRVLRGTTDQNIRFEHLCGLLRRLGFQERVRGSHHIFSRTGVIEILNVQPRDGGMAKPYQVRQVRTVIVKYKLAGTTAEGSE